MPNYNKEVNYVGRDFSILRDSLIEFANLISQQLTETLMKRHLVCYS